MIVYVWYSAFISMKRLQENIGIYGQRSPLLSSFPTVSVEPYKPVSSQRITHWIKDTLKKAGINTDKLTAHPVQGASASAAMGRGLQISDVLRQQTGAGNQLSNNSIIDHQLHPRSGGLES